MIFNMCLIAWKSEGSRCNEVSSSFEEPSASLVVSRPLISMPHTSRQILAPEPTLDLIRRVLRGGRLVDEGDLL